MPAARCSGSELASLRGQKLDLCLSLMASGSCDDQPCRTILYLYWQRAQRCLTGPCVLCLGHPSLNSQAPGLTVWSQLEKLSPDGGAASGSPLLTPINTPSRTSSPAQKSQQSEPHSHLSASLHGCRPKRSSAAT